MPLSMSTRLNTLLLVLLVLMAGTIIAILATRAYGGPLDPSAPPASTMKSLDEIPGSWSRNLDSTNGDLGGGFKPAGCDSSRFKCVLVETQCIVQSCFPIYNTVLDAETGLVWERTPGGASNLSFADFHCLGLTTGGHSAGWRLPTISELLSLFDVATFTLPAGHPFVGVTIPELFWSTSPLVGSTTSFHTFGVGGGLSSATVGGSARPWCVRGAGG